MRPCYPTDADCHALEPPHIWDMGLPQAPEVPA